MTHGGLGQLEIDYSTDQCHTTSPNNTPPCLIPILLIFKKMCSLGTALHVIKGIPFFWIP